MCSSMKSDFWERPKSSGGPRQRRRQRHKAERGGTLLQLSAKAFPLQEKAPSLPLKGNKDL